MTKNLLITRPAPDAHSTAQRLEALGFSCFIEPMLKISSRSDAGDILNNALLNDSILVVTSANAVRAIQTGNLDKDMVVIAVGDATLQAAKDAGFDNVTNGGGSVHKLAEHIQGRYSTGQHFVYACADVVSINLGKQLTQQGFDVTECVVYDATPTENLSNGCTQKLKDGYFDAALFFSSRTAETFVTLITKNGLTATVADQIELFCLSNPIASIFKNTTAKNIHIAHTPTSESLLEIVSNFQFTQECINSADN